ncbi:MAG: alkaline phosphatase family protein [Planctomycetes bacterium]|nr:alkaline phosphatase family protein [Planctomycetota bacterium]
MRFRHAAQSSFVLARRVGALLLLAGSALAATEAKGRVIVLGFDGADAATAERLMNAGELPHLAELRRQGTFAPLMSTMPAESPVSWASLNSGQNPGKTGIPGFIKRSLASGGRPEPDLGHATHTARKLADLPLTGVKRILAGRSAASNAVIGGVVTAALFFALLGLLLSMRRKVALALSLLLGCVGALGAWYARNYLPREISDVVGNPTQTQGFFEIAAAAGVPTVAIDAAMEWDRPDVPNLKLLAGLGVPDVRANNGDWFVYTSRDDEFHRAPEGRGTSTGGRIFRVDIAQDRISSAVFGPRDFYSIDRAEAEVEAIDEQLSNPALPDTKADRLTARRRVLLEEILPRLQGTGAFSGSEAGRIALPLAVELQNGEALVTIGAQSHTVKEGAWSDWYHLTFAMNPLMKAKAITRCKLVKLRDPFELYVDFLQIDPADPMFWQPISRPASFARDLARDVGLPYETVGWACVTMPFKDREIDPIAFMQDIEFTHLTRVKMLEAGLARGDWRLFVDIESTPDRVQHMMYQYADATHPGYVAEDAERTVHYFGREVALRDAIDETYRAMDRLVGDVVKRHLKPGDTLILCSDHGFQSFKRQVHINNWLAREGYLAVSPGTTRADGGYLDFVDWSRTRAYSLGLGGIYVNLRGRERDGIVAPAEVPALLAELTTRLKQLRDEELDRPAVRAVYETAQIHSGDFVGAEADLMIGFEAGYRVSWGTSTGGIALSGEGAAIALGPVFEDNLSTWSGDHVSVAADLVQGVFFSNRKFVLPPEGVNLLHIAPTVLHTLGVPIPAECDKPALEFAP